jgi:plasmid stabilization system protein ParE
VARIELAPEVLEDFDRIFDYLTEAGPSDAAARVMDIVKAIDVLANNPFIGRPVSKQMRDLIIGKRARGYLALYRYEEKIDTVFVLAVRSQREAGYRGD